MVNFNDIVFFYASISHHIKMITYISFFSFIVLLSCIRGFWGNLFSSVVYVLFFLNVDKLFLFTKFTTFSFIVLYYNKCCLYLYSKLVKFFFYESYLGWRMFDNYPKLYFNDACLTEIILSFCLASYFFFIYFKIFFFYSFNKILKLLKSHFGDEFKSFSYLDKSFIQGDLLFLYEFFILLNPLLMSSLFSMNLYIFIYLVVLRLWLDYLPAYFTWRGSILLKKKLLLCSFKHNCHEVCNNLIKLLFFFI